MHLVLSLVLLVHDLVGKPRMVEVSDLFEQKETTTGSNAPTTTVTYKSSSVRQQVQSIKAATRSELKQLRGSAPANSPKNRRSSR